MANVSHLKLTFNSNWRIVSLFLFLFIAIVSFILMRTWGIQNSLEFFGDIGRDHLVLWEWYQSGKPPLIGPGISFLSLNTPPLYYYLNFPIFILSNLSPYTTLITLIALHIAALLIVWLFYPENKIRIFATTSLFLLSLQPQAVLQSRLPWNPSYAPAFLLIALVAIYQIIKNKERNLERWFLAAGLAGSLAMSFGSLPTILILGLAGLILSKERKKLFLAYITTFTLVFLPLAIFDLRHDFYFSSRIFTSTSQLKLTFAYLLKTDAYWRWLLGIKNWNALSIVSATAILLIVARSGYKIVKEKSGNLWRQPLILFSGLFLVAFIATTLIPITARAHDIFGMLMLFLAVIASLPKKSKVMVMLLLLNMWLKPTWIDKYLNPPRRTIEQMSACAQKVCTAERKPMFIATQAWHVFNSAAEYNFLFSKQGCSVKDITHQPQWSDTFALVVDNYSYEHNKTSFNELTLFGPATIENKYECDGNLEVYILKKKL